MELSTPRGAVFCFFSKRKRLQRACLVAMAATQRRLPYVAVTQKLRAVCRQHRFLFLLFLFFFCAFWRSTSFASCKRSVAFFCCCCLRQFWLCLFVRLGVFPAAISLSCLRLISASIIPWTSPFPLVFFLSASSFFAATKDVCCYCSKLANGALTVEECRRGEGRGCYVMGLKGIP